MKTTDRQNNLSSLLHKDCCFAWNYPGSFLSLPLSSSPQKQTHTHKLDQGKDQPTNSLTSLIQDKYLEERQRRC